MNATAPLPSASQAPSTPAELLHLQERIMALPAQVRRELAPLIADALEHARFRERILAVARDALGQYRLDLQLARFDLDATRREHESLRQRLAQGDAGA